MIHGEINLYEKPSAWKPAITGSVFQGVRAKEEAAFEELFKKDLAEAKKLYNLNDQVTLKTNSGITIVVQSFVEDFKDTVDYMGHPCIISGVNANFVNGVPIKYSLTELNYDTRVEGNTQIIYIGDANDCC